MAQYRSIRKKVRGVAIMNKIVIKVLGDEHGKDVFDFFKSKCPDALHRLEWDPYEYEKMFWKDRLYFGCDGGLFGWFTLEEVAENGFRAIELPEDELDIETFKINARDTEFSWPQSNTNSHLLSKAFIIGAKEVVRTIQEDLDELYTERDNMNSMISEKERVLEFYNKKIKEFSGD